MAWADKFCIFSFRTSLKSLGLLRGFLLISFLWLFCKLTLLVYVSCVTMTAQKQGRVSFHFLLFLFLLVIVWHGHVLADRITLLRYQERFLLWLIDIVTWRTFFVTFAESWRHHNSLCLWLCSLSVGCLRCAEWHGFRVRTCIVFHSVVNIKAVITSFRLNFIITSLFCKRDNGHPHGLHRAKREIRVVKGFIKAIAAILRYCFRKLSVLVLVWVWVFESSFFFWDCSLI